MAPAVAFADEGGGAAPAQPAEGDAAEASSDKGVTPTETDAPVEVSADPVERYEAGKAALIAEKLEEAYAAFEQGLRAPETDPLHTWKLLLGAALACEKLERGPAALEYYH